MKRRRRSVAIVSSTVLVASLGLQGLTAASSSAAPAGRSTLAGSHSAAADSSKVLGHVAGATSESFEVALKTQDPAAVTALATAVSNPASPEFHHYLSAAQWEARFSPTAATVASVSSWLASQGLSVGTVSDDRLSIAVTGSAAAVEKAFGVTLNTYRVHGTTRQLAANDASVPAALAGVVDGVVGLDQSIATPAITNGSDAATPAATPSSAPIPQPPGFRNSPVCSKYYGEKVATNAPAYGGGYPSTLPLNPCGYQPDQLQSAYGVNSDLAAGTTGKGVTVAIIDAYASPTLLADAQKYYSINDPAYPLATSQYGSVIAKTFEAETLCSASGWFGEQTLDVEAVHAMAPGANIVYVGAASCLNKDLTAAMRTVVDRHLADIVTNSYGDSAGDLLDPSGYRNAFDTLMQMAATTGITVNFSSGDNGDEFANTGLVSPDYPASSPWVTAVGGTSLAVNADGTKAFQTGWSTSKSVLCTQNYVALGGCTASQLNTYLPPAPGGYDYGGGGGTSYRYSEPYYQVPVVPAALATRNGSTPARVVPDISMDADPTTGMLVGETQTFPDGVYYGQYRIGGTSLASPLMAGVEALADQAAGVPLGFLNPIIYKVDATGNAKGFSDIKPLGKLADLRWDFADGTDNVAGTIHSVRTLDFEGTESYTDGTGVTASRPVAITVAKGYDGMTGLGTPDIGFVGVLAKY